MIGNTVETSVRDLTNVATGYLPHSPSKWFFLHVGLCMGQAVCCVIETALG